MDHAKFDKRNYPILEVRQGYAEWVHTYEQTVRDEMDLHLLARARSVDWSAVKTVVDLACGTGRIGDWLRQRGTETLDGVDLTPEMLALAKKRGIYRSLTVADVAATGLQAHTYDLCIQSLADEHLPELGPLYREATRLATPSGRFVIVGFHPQFLMAGVPTHFDRAPGDPVSIRSYVHLLSDHAKAAHAAGWTLQEMDEGVVDEAWLRKKPKWVVYEGTPISFLMVWRM